MIFTVLTAAWAAPLPPPVDLAAQERHERKTGIWMTTTGVLLAGGGVAVMSVGRGDPADISEETLLVSDLRSAGGAALLLGGITTTVIGTTHLAEARTLRREQRGLTFTFGGNHLALSGRF